MIIQCDFDGTIIRNNLSVLLREKYAGGDWQKIDSDYLHGQLTVEQSNKLQFTLIKEPKEKLQEFARQHVEIRPGFVEFVGYCRESAIPLVIVSTRFAFFDNSVLCPPVTLTLSHPHSFMMEFWENQTQAKKLHKPMACSAE